MAPRQDLITSHYYSSACLGMTASGDGVRYSKSSLEIEEQMLATEGRILPSYTGQDTGEDCRTWIRVVQKGVGFHLR